MNLLERIREIRQTCPPEMVEQVSAEVLVRISALQLIDTVPVQDLAWLFAQMVDEMANPKVYQSIISDAVSLRSSAG